MTIFFQSHQITIKRAKLRGNNIYAASATYTAAYADIQAVDAPRVNDLNGRLGKTYEGWVDSAVDVKEGDVIVSGGISYSVAAVAVWQGAGLLDHKYLLLEAKN